MIILFYFFGCLGLSAKRAAVIRASDDFWPRDPASHTIHIASVAYNTIFLGEFMQPDWDMFHVCGNYVLLFSLVDFIVDFVGFSLHYRFTILHYVVERTPYG